MKKAISVFSLAFLLGMAAPHEARSELAFTGDPLADGWSFVGNSLTLGTYVRGAANFNYNLFSTGYTISAGNPLITNFAGTGWQAGDEVLGVGGFILDQTAANLDTTARMVAKYGTSTATFSPSTLPSPNGNGNTSFTNGNSGQGGIELSVAAGSVTPGSAGVARLPDNSDRFDNGRVTVSNDFGRFNQTYLGGKPKSWEFLLNISLLQRAGLSPPGPMLDNLFIATLQRSNFEFTDGIGPLTAVPEPSSLALAGLGGAIGVFALLRRRRIRK